MFIPFTFSLYICSQLWTSTDSHTSIHAVFTKTHSDVCSCRPTGPAHTSAPWITLIPLLCLWEPSDGGEALYPCRSTGNSVDSWVTLTHTEERRRFVCVCVCCEVRLACDKVWERQQTGILSNWFTMFWNVGERNLYLCAVSYTHTQLSKSLAWCHRCGHVCVTVMSHIQCSGVQTFKTHAVHNQWFFFFFNNWVYSRLID